MTEIFKPIEIKYKVEVLDKGRRKRVIKDNLSKKILRKHPVPIKGKNVDCKVVLLPIGVPVYHLNNGRTRSAQRSHIIRNNHFYLAILILRYFFVYIFHLINLHYHCLGGIF